MTADDIRPRPCPDAAHGDPWWCESPACVAIPHEKREKHAAWRCGPPGAGYFSRSNWRAYPRWLCNECAKPYLAMTDDELTLLLVVKRLEA